MCMDRSTDVYHNTCNVVFDNMYHLLLWKRCMVCKGRSGSYVYSGGVLCRKLQEKMHRNQKVAANPSLYGNMVCNNAWNREKWIQRFCTISHNYSDYCFIFCLGKHISQIVKNSLHIRSAVL